MYYVRSYVRESYTLLVWRVWLSFLNLISALHHLLLREVVYEGCSFRGNLKAIDPLPFIDHYIGVAESIDAESTPANQ